LCRFSHMLASRIKVSSARCESPPDTDWLYVTMGPRQNQSAMISRLLSPASESGNTPKKFEDLLARLEQIVSDMENGEMPLEKLLANYEEGMRLVKACGDRLVDAEQKVEILSRAVAADPGKADPASSPTEKEPAQPEDDIRLF